MCNSFLLNATVLYVNDPSTVGGILTGWRLDVGSDLLVRTRETRLPSFSIGPYTAKHRGCLYVLSHVILHINRIWAQLLLIAVIAYPAVTQAPWTRLCLNNLYSPLSCWKRTAAVNLQNWRNDEWIKHSGVDTRQALCIKPFAVLQSAVNNKRSRRTAYRSTEVESAPTWGNGTLCQTWKGANRRHTQETKKLKWLLKPIKSGWDWLLYSHMSCRCRWLL